MLTLIIGLIGFFTAEPAVLGAQIIQAFDYMLVLYCIGAIIATFFSVVMILGLTATGGLELGKLGAVFGFVGGGFITAFLFIRVVFNLYIAYYIMDTTPVDATLFADLPLNTQYAIYAWALLLLLAILKPSSSTTTNNDSCEVDDSDEPYGYRDYKLKNTPHSRKIHNIKFLNETGRR